MGRAVWVVWEWDPTSFREVARQPRVRIRLIFLLSSAGVRRPISIKIRVFQDLIENCARSQRVGLILGEGAIAMGLGGTHGKGWR